MSRLAQAILSTIFAHAAYGLEFQTVMQASGGTHAITIDEVDFLPSLYPGVKTRGFQNGMGGPTFRMAPGETLSMILTNNLVSSNNVACTATAGEFCEASTTNFHTHGLHISGEGNADNVFTVTPPGSSDEHVYELGSDHGTSFAVAVGISDELANNAGSVVIADHDATAVRWKRSREEEDRW